jgi:hypothetical protein
MKLPEVRLYYGSRLLSEVKLSVESGKKFRIRRDPDPQRCLRGPNSDHGTDTLVIKEYYNPSTP